MEAPAGVVYRVHYSWTEFIAPLLGTLLWKTPLPLSQDGCFNAQTSRGQAKKGGPPLHRFSGPEGLPFIEPRQLHAGVINSVKSTRHKCLNYLAF